VPHGCPTRIACLEGDGGVGMRVGATLRLRFSASVCGEPPIS
jgi:hypothetical protein